jgi:hypothetical protein
VTRPPRRILRRLLGLSVGLLLAASALEVGLRVFDPYHYRDDDAVRDFARALRDTRPIAPALSSFYLTPGAHIEFLGHSFDINERGYRTPTVPYAKPADVHRIVVVGDSVPFGWGVAESECFPRSLETKLNAKSAPFGKQRVEVINLSGPGRGLGDYLIVLQNEAMRYEPDHVVIPLVFNDVPVLEVIPPEKRKPGPGPLPDWLNVSYAARFIHVLQQGIRGAEMGGDYWIGIRTSPEALAAFPFAFRAFKSAAGQVPILLFDTIGEAPGQGVPEIAKAAADAEVERLECFLDLREWPTKWAIRAPKHNHPNAAAHAYYADRLLDWFTAHGW